MITKEPKHKVERHFVTNGVEVYFAFVRELVFKVDEKLRQAVSEKWDEFIVKRSENRENQALDKGMFGFRRVKISTNAVTTGESCGRHVSADQNV